MFKNPYLPIPKGTEASVFFRVPESEKNLLLAIRPQQGTETVVMTMLYKLFCDSLRAAGLGQINDQKKLEEMVSNMKLTFGGPPTTKGKKS